jgi:hypothetical protein
LITITTIKRFSEARKKRNVDYCQRVSDDAGIYSVTGCIGIFGLNAVADVLLLFVFTNGIN